MTKLEKARSARAAAVEAKDRARAEAERIALHLITMIGIGAFRPCDTVRAVWDEWLAACAKFEQAERADAAARLAVVNIEDAGVQKEKR